MAFVAGTTYFLKVLQFDKQGNQATSTQAAVAADGVHLADIGSDLAQTFGVHNTAGITFPGGANANQILKYNTTDWSSGLGTYAPATGLYTAGSAGRFRFTGQAEIAGLVMPNTGTMRLALRKNGVDTIFGPNAQAVVDSLAASTTGNTTAAIDAILSLALNDTVGLAIYWLGLPGKTIASNVTNFFQGEILAG